MKDEWGRAETRGFETSRTAPGWEQNEGDSQDGSTRRGKDLLGGGLFDALTLMLASPLIGAGASTAAPPEAEIGEADCGHDAGQ